MDAQGQNNTCRLKNVLHGQILPPAGRPFIRQAAKIKVPAKLLLPQFEIFTIYSAPSGGPSTAHCFVQPPINIHLWRWE